jgi:hypothetical protein
MDKMKNLTVFDRFIKKSAYLVKYANEIGDDMQYIEKLNNEVDSLSCKLLDRKFTDEEVAQINRLSTYIYSVIGKNYFYDKRCESYLYDMVFDYGIRNINRFVTA